MNKKHVAKQNFEEPCAVVPARTDLRELWVSNHPEPPGRVLLQSGSAEVNEAYDLYLRFNQDEELRQLEEARQQCLHDYNTEIKYAETGYLLCSTCLFGLF